MFIKPPYIKMAPEYPKDADLTENARTVLERRYLKTDEDGNPVEEPEDLFARVAGFVARPSREKYGASPQETQDTFDKFYNAMAEGKFMPNSPTLFNAGRDLGNLSACFVLPVEDTMTSPDNDGILDSASNAALIHKSGGGTGFSFSRIRPRGDRVQSTNGVASGPVSFMRMYSDITDTIKQGGNRRGANMGILRVDHPDILEFIDCKTEKGEIENFNISVAVTEDFMEKARNNEDYELTFEGEVYDTLNASDVLDRIIDNAHKNGEPGLFFIDRANEDNPISHLGRIEATNPCGEIPLPPYDVCNLGHVNIAKFVNEDGSIDGVAMAETIHTGVRFLDNVIDANDYPLPEIRERSDKTRRIGLGVMGWADALIKMGIPYDSPEAIEKAKRVAEFVHGEAIIASRELAEERGPFPEFEESDYEYPRRNAYVNTVAPTGTTSIIAGCSGGIEPNYAFAFQRNQAGTKMIEVHEEARKRIGDTDGMSLAEIREQVASDPVLRSAHDITPEWHIRMQAAWQEHTEQAISKTINFPEYADPQDIREGYMLADKLGCKGITVYRDGSREGQALSMGDEDDSEQETKEMKERPDVLKGYTYRIDAPTGSGYVNINELDGEPFEVFVNVGKAGGAAMANAEAIGRLISLNLRSGIDLADIIKQLKGIGSQNATGLGPNRALSIPDEVAKALERYSDSNVAVENDGNGIGACPECDAELAFTEGCEECPSCGYSACG